MNKKEIVTAEDKFARAREYWLDHLSGESEELFIPRDFSPTKEYSPAHYSLELGSSLTEKLNTAAKNDGLSLYVLLLTAFKILLHQFTGYRYSGRQDITILAPTLARSQQQYNKWVVLKSRLDSRLTFKELLMAAKETVVQGYKNQHYPFGKLVNDLHIEDPSSLFNVIFLLEDIHRLEKGNISPALGKDIIFSLKSEPSGPPMLSGDICYNARAFKEETIARMFSCYSRILEQVMADPSLKPLDLELVTVEEKQRLLEDFNNTGYQYPGDKPLHELFAEEAARYPQQTAVMDLTVPGTRVCLSYKELDNKAEKVAGLLKHKGMTSNSVVAVWAERSWELPTAMLAILKAGGAYLALDPRFPPERIKFMLADSSVRMLVTMNKHSDNPIFGSIENNTRIIRLPDEEIYRDIEQLKDEPVTGPEAVKVMNSDPAYVIYTSGSTGIPKGVLVEHRNVVRLVKNANFIRLQQGDRLLLTGSPAFDIITFEIWGSLLNGLTLVMPDPDSLLNPEKLKTVTRENNISILHLVPQVLSQCIGQAQDLFIGLKYLLVGGDWVNPAHINLIRKLHTDLTILHMYGPTEATTFSTFYQVDRHFEAAVPLGKPVNDTFVSILGWGNGVQPLGAVGELVLGGSGLARGYINKPELTAEKFAFIPSRSDTSSWSYRSSIPYKSFPPGRIPGRIYRTGDLARWSADGSGNIEFLGRIDRQVKIRGVRIEPGEIERWLSGHPGIKEAVVVAWEDPFPIDEKHQVHEEVQKEQPGRNEKYLCAYYVPVPAGGTAGPAVIPAEELKARLKEQFPEYMIPSYFQPLDELPLTIGGKIDRSRLPLPEVTPGKSFVAPRNRREEEIAAIWAEILKIDKSKIGIDDNFFELGGHSLRATGLIVRMHKKFNIKIPIAEIFKVPTIRNFSEYMNSIRRDTSSALEMVEEREYYPLSPAQRQTFIFLQVNPDNTVYNGLEVLALEGRLQGERIEETFKKLIRRHDSLRISFDLTGEMKDTPVLKVNSRVDFKVEWYDLAEADNGETVSAWDSGSGAGFQVGKAAQAVIEGFVRPFDFTRAPLLRVGLIKLRPDRHLMLVDIHHIISDGYSRDIFVREFKLLYKEEEHEKAGENGAAGPLPGLAVQYKDYAVWQQRRQESPLIKKQEEFWLKLFSGEIPVLELPVDYPRPPVRSFEGRQMRFRLPAEHIPLLKAFVKEREITMFIMMLTLLNLFLAKLSGQEDIVIGFDTAGRSHADLEHLIGMFVNTMAIRTFPQQSKSFAEFLREVKTISLEAMENQDYLLERLVDKVLKKRDPGRHPLYDVMYTYINLEMLEVEIPGLKITPYQFTDKRSHYDIVLFVFEEKDDFLFVIEYCTALFKPETIETYSRYFTHMVGNLLQNPGQKLGEIQLVSPEEEKQLLKNLRDKRGVEFVTVKETPGSGSAAEPLEADLDL